MAKMIRVDDCISCPLVNSCKQWQNLTPQQRFILKTGTGIKNAILKNCPLDDINDADE